MERYLGIHLNSYVMRAAFYDKGGPVKISEIELADREGCSFFDPPCSLFRLDESGTCYDCQLLNKRFQTLRADVGRMVDSGDSWKIVLVVPNAFPDRVIDDFLRPAAESVGMPVACVLRETEAVALYYFSNGMGKGEESYPVTVAAVTEETISASTWELADDIAEELAAVGTAQAVSQSKLQECMEQTMKEAGLFSQTALGSRVRALLVNYEGVNRLGYKELLRQMKLPGQKIYSYPEDSAALGGALHGARLAGQIQKQDSLLLTAVPHDYCIQTADGHQVVLLERNTAVPARRSMVFTTKANGQTDMEINLWTNTGGSGTMHWVAAAEQRGLTPLDAGQTRVLVTLEADTKGSVKLSSREMAQGEEPDLPVRGVLPMLFRKAEVLTEESEEPQRVPAPPEYSEVMKDVVSLAEFENFRRRMTQEKDVMYDKGICKAIEKFLPVIDSFERGLAMLTPEQKTAEAAVGMERIYRQMLKSLEELGVRPIQAVGQSFDLKFHNAVMQGEVPGVAENIILEEFEKGYLYHDTVVRYSIVKVNK